MLLMAAPLTSCVTDDTADAPQDRSDGSAALASGRDEKWRIANEAYRDGRLGPPEEVLASMRSVAEDEEWTDQQDRPADARFYRGDGSLKELDEMTVTQEIAYLDWLGGNYVREHIGDELDWAAADARERRATAPDPPEQ